MRVGDVILKTDFQQLLAPKVDHSPYEMHAVTCWNDKSGFNKPKRFAKQQLSNVDIALASVYCYLRAQS